MKLQEPIEINGMVLKNRLGFAPLLNMPADEGGFVNDHTVKWFDARAAGGTAFIMTGAVGASAPRAPAPQRLLGGRGIGLYDDKFIPGFARIAEAVHAHGAKLGVQMGVIGGAMGGRGPSPPPYPDERHGTDDRFFVMAGRRIPHTEVTIEEIEQSQDDVAAAAARAKAAGVDCVLLHCSHGGATGGCSFISPYYNRRTDKYGGSWENRLRHPVETIRKMRAAVGPDYPIHVRICGDQLIGSRGITIRDTTSVIVPTLEAAGVDAFDVSQGDMLRAGEGVTIPLYYPRGCFIHIAAAVKQVTKLPVIGVGNIFDLDMAERFLQEGKADIIHLGRQLCADPDTVKKYFEGRPEDVRKCIGDVGGCGNPCTVNYDIQNEPIPLTPAEKPKKVLVIGGGVGGMEAARIAATRGHKVTLMEKEPGLGGMVATLALNPLTGEMRNLVDYLTTQIGKLGVDVRVCHAASLADVEELAPDVVILATGSSASIPDVAAGVPGVMTHREASMNRRAIGQRVVVWGLFGVELAISLAEDGKDVVLLGKGNEGSLGSDVSTARQWWLMRKLTDINVPRENPMAARISNPRVLYNVEVEDVAIDQVTVRIGGDDSTRQVIPYDTVIVSQRFGERQANDSLFDQLEGKVSEVHRIGDCAQIRGIQEAIFSANEVARKI
jgi:2,4-dienoyl-CoA reductase (NADPH2)